MSTEKLEQELETYGQTEGLYLVGPARLRELLCAEAKLEALYAGGVEDWDWYEASLEDHYQGWED